MAKSIFRDKTTVTIKAGDGGDGGIFFDKMRKPSGGFGGDGGDVYVEGDSNMPFLSELRYGEKYYADDGDSGNKNNQTGKKGESLLIKVPLVTNIYDDNGEKIAEIKEHGERVKIAEGGRGGVGNHYYRKGGFATKEKFKPGETGQEIKATFEYEIDSDIILIGFPNAGKSSILSEMTNANSKIGAYAFTTIFPVLGLLQGLRILDLPGLIEDTHQGKGLGTNFVKHTRRADMIAHCVSFENEDMIETYKRMRSELEKIDEQLSQKPEIIVLTKSDVANPEKREKIQKEFKKKFKLPTFIFSTFDVDAREEFRDWLKEQFKILTKAPS